MLQSTIDYQFTSTSVFQLPAFILMVSLFQEKESYLPGPLTGLAEKS